MTRLKPWKCLSLNGGSLHIVRRNNFHNSTVHLGYVETKNGHVIPAIYGTCYTSTLRGEYDGACKRPASEVLKNPERWDYLEYECSDEDFDKMIAAMDYAVKHNKGYDIALILRFLAFVPVFNSRKYICTEFVQMGMSKIERIFYGFPGMSYPKHRGYSKIASLGIDKKPLSPKALAKILPGTMKQLTAKT